MKFFLAVFLATLPLFIQAQTDDSDTNKAPVVIYVSRANAALITDFESNGVPVDTIITLGARAALNQARGRLLDQINHMTLPQLAAAYPQLVSIVDTNASESIQEQQLRSMALMQLSRVKTSGDANRVYSLNYFAETNIPSAITRVFITPQPFQIISSTNSSSH